MVQLRNVYDSKRLKKKLKIQNSNYNCINNNNLWHAIKMNEFYIELIS